MKIVDRLRKLEIKVGRIEIMVWLLIIKNGGELLPLVTAMFT